MNDVADFARIRRSETLSRWAQMCQEEMHKASRYPTIAFDSDTWPIRSAHNAKMQDIKLAATMKAFSHLDDSYAQAVRCWVAEAAIEDVDKTITWQLLALRLLTRGGPYSLLDIDRQHLIAIERSVVTDCQRAPQAANGALRDLQLLERFVGRLSRLQIIDTISWRVSNETHGLLKRLNRQRREQFKQEKASIIDRQIAALSDAMQAMLAGDERLSVLDRAALALVGGVLMCAPSRVNEPLCMAVDDVCTVEDYAQRPDGRDRDELHKVHMLLLMKGSKGAEWSGKPALNFMIELLKACMDVLAACGARSRMLAQWYELHPDEMYLPSSLAGLRGTLISRRSLWQIINLSDQEPANGGRTASVNRIWAAAKGANKIVITPNARSHRADGSINAVKTVEAIAWEDLEPILLNRVRKAMADVCRVSENNQYVGRVSKMLALFDYDESPYLPGSIKYSVLKRRFNQTPGERDAYRRLKGKDMEPTVFAKLRIAMVVDGKVETAWIGTHDPRRWLTTQALKAKERLSDVLINKWANRLSIDQLKHYDLRSPVERADQAAMPAIEELADFSAALGEMEEIEAEYGLRTELVVAHETGVSVTSMEAIASAVGDRPAARTSKHLIILYPSRYGVCLHQHHETPCRSYSSCGACNEDVVVKGHLPTNAEVRRRDGLLTGSIVSQIDQLITAHNRGIADSVDGLEEHMLTLVHRGLGAEELAIDLIERFHEIKDRIKSPCFKTKLEEAFVMRGMVKRLDDPIVPTGALMRYHNPSRHASPGHERALDAHGGRTAIEARLEQFHLAHPRFAPTNLGLEDERELLEPEGDDDDE